MTDPGKTYSEQMKQLKNELGQVRVGNTHEYLDDERIQEQYEGGLTAQEIAELYENEGLKVSIKTIYNRLRKKGVVIRRRGALKVDKAEQK